MAKSINFCKSSVFLAADTKFANERLGTQTNCVHHRRQFVSCRPWKKNNYAKCAIGHFEIENNVCDDLIDTQVKWAAVKREWKVDIVEITLVESRWIIWHILPISQIWRVLKIRWVKHSSNFMACTHVLLVKYSRLSGLLFIHLKNWNHSYN